MVLNWGRHTSAGCVTKFSGAREPLRAPQHGKLDQINKFTNKYICFFFNQRTWNWNKGKLLKVGVVEKRLIRTTALKRCSAYTMTPHPCKPIRQYATDFITPNSITKSVKRTKNFKQTSMQQLKLWLCCFRGIDRLGFTSTNLRWFRLAHIYIQEDSSKAPLHIYIQVISLGKGGTVESINHFFSYESISCKSTHPQS